MNVTKEELIEAFEIWEKENGETPEEFGMVENYAEACANYLIELLEKVKS